MKILLIIITILFFGISIHAQTQFAFIDNEVLSYIKTEGGIVTFISLVGDETSALQINENECVSISYDGRYLAVSSREPSLLSIIYLPNQETIFSTTWLPSWNPCVFTWTENNYLVIIDLNRDRQFFEFKNLTLMQIPIPTIELTYPDLPNFFPSSEENLLLPNPTNPNIYLYEKCPSGILSEGYCVPGTSTQMVIYDLANQQEIHTLQYIAPSYYLRGNTVVYDPRSSLRGVNAPLASWSLDGRYLAYFNLVTGGTIPHDGRIVIYDLQTNRYLNDSRGLYLPNINRKLEWSVNNVLLMWNTGPFGEIYSYEFHDKLTLFRFFNADTETYVEADKKFDVLDTRYLIPSERAWFAPNGRAIAFIGKERVIPEQLPEFDSSPQNADLVIISTANGESTIIDTNIAQIITWRSICDFTVSDATSLIATMQTEPYSVICLDENATYTLTVPLPTITGDITVIGNGAQIVMTGTGRVFDVASTGGLTLKSITVSGGNAVQGGAIYNAGDLTLENVVLENNSATDGGAIYNVGSLTMDGGAIQNNTATNLGGGIYTVGDTLDLDGVNIRDNDAVEGSGVYQGR